MILPNECHDFYRDLVKPWDPLGSIFGDFRISNREGPCTNPFNTYAYIYIYDTYITY